MHQTLSPLKTQFIEQDRKYLEVIILLITHNVNHLVNRIISETKFGRTNILCHVDRGSVTTKKQFVIQSFGSQVRPYGTIFFLEEETLLEPFHHLLFSFEVSIGFIIYLVEADTHHLVSLIKSCIYPVVHHLPQSAYFRVTGFPLHQHLTGFLHQRRFRFGFRLRFFIVHPLSCKLSHQFLHFGFIMLIERYIIVTHQMIALLARSLRCFTVSVFLPCQHGFTDMDTTVVYDISLYYLVAVGSYNVSQCVT